MNLTWESTFADGIFQTNGNNGFGSMLDIAGVNTARRRNLAMLHNLSTEITNHIDRVLFTITITLVDICSLTWTLN